MDTSCFLDPDATAPKTQRKKKAVHTDNRRDRSDEIDPAAFAVAIVLATSIGGAARAAGVSRTLIYPWLDVPGGIPTFKIGKRRLVRIEALREFLLRREQEAQQ